MSRERFLLLEVVLRFGCLCRLVMIDSLGFLTFSSSQLLNLGSVFQLIHRTGQAPVKGTDDNTNSCVS